MSSTVRTRFAPSPTGFLHIGGARTALFAWAYARRHGGRFILRIEDTDVARSTPEAVQAILDGMNWLDLKWDEGPFYQMQRMERYKAVIQQMLDAGTAYHCYTTPEELEVLREAQRERGDKPRYDGRWRPEAGKMLPTMPAGVQPVVRFKNPPDGVVAWDDLVKGRIEIANAEMDDLVIARTDGTPTYNFCVVVDDWDMGITQVIRGDDHVNNTPRQINILRALGAVVPQYAHLSMILGDDGTKLSKRHGAVSVMQYDEDGYLPEAVVNYLARLGWSHGDEEVFTREQFVEWFDLDHITPSAAQFNTEKFKWLNAHYIKQTDAEKLAINVQRRLSARGISTANGPELAAVIMLYRDRAHTLVELADSVAAYYVVPTPSEELLTQHLTDAAKSALASLASRLKDVAWEKTALSQAIKETCAELGLKMPQVAIPLRVTLLGVTQTPSIDAVLEVMGRERVLARLPASSIVERNTRVLRVTFDTNTLDRAVRPERFPKDPLQSDYEKVHQAILDGRIEGFFSETIIHLEGIQKNDRSEVIGSTTLTHSEEVTVDPTTGVTAIVFTMTADQPLRKPLHPEVAARVRAALDAGMRLLKAPRTGNPRINDPASSIFAIEKDEDALANRLQIYQTVLRELDTRAVGFAQLKQLAGRFAARGNAQEPWFQSLLRAIDVHEDNAVKRAVAEWADGDSVAAHIGYGIDYFCTEDQGKSSGAPSVFDSTHRAWLEATYGTKFITLAQLAAMV